MVFFKIGHKRPLAKTHLFHFSLNPTIPDNMTPGLFRVFLQTSEPSRHLMFYPHNLSINSSRKPQESIPATVWHFFPWPSVSGKGKSWDLAQDLRPNPGRKASQVAIRYSQTAKPKGKSRESRKPTGESQGVWPTSKGRQSRSGHQSQHPAEEPLSGAGLCFSLPLKNWH